MEIEIREADYNDPAHQAGIVEVLDALASDPIGGGVPLAADARARLIPMLREHPTALVLLAFAEGRPAGLATCFFGLSTFQARPLLNIHDLVVLPGWRGRGIGRRLLAAAEERARLRGCCKLTLEVQDENSPARRLYQRFGFDDFGPGEPVLTRFLSKKLAEEA